MRIAQRELATMDFRGISIIFCGNLFLYVLDCNPPSRSIISGLIIAISIILFVIIRPYAPAISKIQKLEEAMLVKRRTF